jgi:hypothetical protein
MGWIILGVSCAAILTGMHLGQVTLAVGGLAGLLIGLWIGPTEEP